MARKYDITKKSGMRRFERDLRKDIVKQTESILRKKPVQVECPHCHQPIKIHAGSNVCPFCKQLVRLNLDI